MPRADFWHNFPMWKKDEHNPGTEAAVSPFPITQTQPPAMDDSSPALEKSALSDSHSTTSKHLGETVITPHIEIDPIAERRLVWKIDLRLLPVLAVMYLFNSLDKSNLGNAKTAGLEADLGMKGTNKYSLILSIFFVPYVLTAPFLGILGKRYGPNRVLPCMMLVFGTCTLCVAGVKNWSGLFAIRWFLGMSESAFFPLVIYYQTTFYRRGELARRLAIFYAAQSIASAFSGLLSFGVFQIKGGSLEPWRYLFLIEGGGTVLFAFFALWYLPLNASTWSVFSEEEKQLAYDRMLLDSSSVVNEKLNIRESLKIFKHPTSWAVLAIQVCLGVPLQGVQLFLPQIIGRLGYSTVKTNLYTVAPNVSGAVMLLVLAFASDYTRLRFPFVALGFLFTFIGMTIYAGIDVEHRLQVAYFASFMMTWGTSAPSVLLDVWYNNNTAHEGRRLILTSVAVPLANMMGVVASNIFRNEDAPRYIPALATTAAFGGMGFVLTMLLGGWMWFDNKRRDRAQGRRIAVRDIPTEMLRDGPAVPEFRWFL
jgi:MFS family permease